MAKLTRAKACGEVELVKGHAAVIQINAWQMRPVGSRSRFVSIGVLIAAAALLLAFDPATTWWFPSCPFRTLTGWQCPLCGSLRALHALLRGSPADALACNPLTVVCLAAWVLERDRTTTFWFSPRGLAIFIAFGVLRNVPGPSGWPGH